MASFKPLGRAGIIGINLGLEVEDDDSGCINGASSL